MEAPIVRSVYIPLGAGRRREPAPAKGQGKGGVKGVKSHGKRNLAVVSYGKGGVNTQDQQTNKPLTVLHLHLNIPENTRDHHTDEYDLCQPLHEHGKQGKLVVRRGQSFDISLEFNRPYDQKNDDLRIVFEAGDSPSLAKGTEVDMILSDKDLPNQWGAKILKQDGNFLTVTIFTPPTCYVAAWDFSIDVVEKQHTDVTVFRYEHPDHVYIIFNPWCKDDAVYVGDEQMIAEYVMNETGRLYMGSKKQITYKPWVFGQFESVILEVALSLISDIPIYMRGNPVPIVRVLSNTVNDRVLMGQWSTPYVGGRSPLSWTGSVAILEQFWETERKVKYGQCWVFSGLCTTLARALGIPARSLTNFMSAHDTDGSMTVDILCDQNGEPEDHHSDSIWNFHVWNEAWMARDDLPTGYGGWQAFDATPQEISDGVYCCGPVSVAAVKQGAVNMPFDGPFVFAEVNADRFWWMPDDKGRVKCAHVEKSLVGKFISTKMPNSDEREDITNQYKPQEGSPEERAAVLKANQLSSTRPNAYERQVEDVQFEVVQDHENTWVGSDFNVSLRMTNTSMSPRTVSGKMVVKTMYYTGVIADKLAVFNIHKTLGARMCEVEQMSVKAKDYVDYLKDCCMLDVSVWVSVKETNQTFVNKEDFRLRKPRLVISGRDEVTKGQEFEVDVSFTNPLDMSLTECVITVDGLARTLRFPQKNVSAKGTVMATLPITPAKLGQKELVIVFSSKQLDGINGSKLVFAQGKRG